MAIEKREQEYAKEFDDVMTLIYELVKVIREKGDYMALMPQLINAINGIDEIDDEMKTNLKAFVLTGASRFYDVVELFTKKENVAA